MVHVPTVIVLAKLPLTEQIDGVSELNVMGKPDEAVAKRATVNPEDVLAIVLKMMLCPVTLAGLGLTVKNSVR